MSGPCFGAFLLTPCPFPLFLPKRRPKSSRPTIMCAQSRGNGSVNLYLQLSFLTWSQEKRCRRPMPTPSCKDRSHSSQLHLFSMSFRGARAISPAKARMSRTQSAQPRRPMDRPVHMPSTLPTR